MKNNKGKQTEEYYQEESKKYDQKRFCSPIGKYIDDIEKLMVLKNLKKGNVLELCCGTGRFASYLFKKGFNYTGVDFSVGMLSKAKAKNKECNVRFIRSDVKDLRKKIKQESFDNIFVARAVKFWQDPKQVINDSYRLLKKNGKLILCFQAKDKSLSRILYKLSQKTQDKHIFLRSYKVGTEKYYHSKQITNMMKNAGFKIIKKRCYFNFFAYTCFMKRLDPLSQKLLAKFFRIFDNHLNFGWRTVIVGVKK